MSILVEPKVKARPNPDEILERINRDSLESKTGRLKIFLGMAAGVGKTYAMLSEAHEQSKRDLDVVIGFVETHGRAETQALIDGLEILPLKDIEYRDTSLKEFDLDGALLRHPEILVLDELPHTNAPGSRHLKRWQDIEELLRAGINVVTAMNVQHFESLNDVVASITGVKVRETIPDDLLERAQTVELIDIPADELRQRLTEGKIYPKERIESALNSFFKDANLVALRELALRKAADSVGAQVQNYRSETGSSEIWATNVRIIVCISPSKLAAKVVRSGARFAAITHGQAIAVYVKTDKQKNRAPEDQAMANEALSMAQELGMETVVLRGTNIAEEITDFAKKRNATLIVVGKPIFAAWKERLSRSIVDELVRLSGNIDVHILTDDQAMKPKSPTRKWNLEVSVQSILMTLGIVGIATGICFLIHSRLELVNLVMIYLVGVTIVASRFRQLEVIIATFLSIALFDFCFVPPRFTFAVSDGQYIITFFIMMAVALVISSLTLRIREEARVASDRERRASSLYVLSRALSKSRSKLQLAEEAIRAIEQNFEGELAIYLNRPEGMEVVARTANAKNAESKEQAVALWVCEHGEPAGKWTHTLPSSVALYLPLKAAQNTLGALSYEPREGASFGMEDRHLLETFANSLSLALERAQLAKESQDARIQVESEKIRSALLSSISHDLRTPLTSIAGAASSLKEGVGNVHELSETIFAQSNRLNAHVQNLLDMTRLQLQDIELNLEWQVMEELIGDSLAAAKPLLENRKITVTISPDVPLLLVDGLLVERVFANVLENAAVHTPAGGPIDIHAKLLANCVEVTIADSGPGIHPGDETKIFDRSYKRERSDSGGFGLGLTISRAIMKLHQGRIWVKNRSEGKGSVFVIEFPKPELSPSVPKEKLG